MEDEKLNVNPMTLEVLAKALEHDEPVALKSTGRNPGLLPGGAATKAKKDAQAECLDHRLGLFEKSGADSNPKVRITRTGLEVLFAQSEPPRRKALLTKAAASLLQTANEVAAKLAEVELREVIKEQKSLAHRAGAIRAQLVGMLQEQLAGVEGVLAELTKQAEELRRLAERTEAPGPQSERPGSEPQRIVEEPKTSGPRALAPTADADIDFQRDLCRELALVWEDTPQPQAREALERVMFNAGLEQIGEVGEVVPFDAGRHKMDAGNGALPSQPVRIIEQGWQFRSPRGVLPVVLPRVVSASQ